MNNNFLGIRGLYKTHMDELKPFNSKSVTYTYIGYTEHNSRGQPIVWRGAHSTGAVRMTSVGGFPHLLYKMVSHISTILV